MLISEDYRKQQQHLHDTTEYGTASKEYAPLVAQIVDRIGVEHLLDYGCGSMCNLARTMFDKAGTKGPKLEHIQPGHKFRYQAYDPAVPRFADRPIPAQMVACIDVLEHVEPECLDDVLDDLRALTEAVLFCTIHTGPAQKILPDGRNAHINQQPMNYWLPKLWERFELQTVQVTGANAFYVIGYAKALLERADGRKAA